MYGAKKMAKIQSGLKPTSASDKRTRKRQANTQATSERASD